MTAHLRGPIRFVLFLSVAFPLLARASGTDIPENGAVMLGRGGTGVSELGDAYALQFNPAGMAFLDGLDVRIDARAVNHLIGFARSANEQTTFDSVSNSAGLYTAPAVEVAYRLPWLGRRLALGLGVWGPAGVGHYAYPDPLTTPSAVNCPKDQNCSSDIATETPQRYALIESKILILYPSLGLSWRILPQLAAGVTLQDAQATVDFRQAIAELSGSGEDPSLDAIAHLNATDASHLTAVFGLAAEPMPRLHVGASFRPQIVFNASGTLKVDLSDAAKQLGYKVTGDQAKLQFVLPPMARLGATFVVSDRLNVSGEATWEGWRDNKEMILTPVGITVKSGSTTTKLTPMHIAKNWSDSWGGRVGGTFTALTWGGGAPMLDVLAGGLYETNAIPSAYQSIDFVTGNRLGGSLGLTFHWQGFALTASGMMYAPVSIAVTDSKVARAAASTENPPVIVGNGTYTSAGWIAAVGLAYTGLGGK